MSTGSSAWTERLFPEAQKDLRKLGEPLRSHAVRAIKKVLQNPLPQSEGGFGKPLGNVGGTNLTGLMKIKLRGDGIRIVYYLERPEKLMHVVVVGIRQDSFVYSEAARRMEK